MTKNARIAPEGADIDTLEAVDTTTVKGGSLRPGMILLDEFDCPSAVVDHRIGSAGPRTGAIRFLVANLDSRGWSEITVGANSNITVAAR